MENNNNNADVFRIKNIPDEQIREIALSQSSVNWSKIFDDIKNMSDEQIKKIALSQSSVDWSKIFEINK